MKTNAAWGVRAGASYVDVGTLNGYREAMLLLRDTIEPAAVRPVRVGASLRETPAKPWRARA